MVLEAGLYGLLWKFPFKNIPRYVQSHSLTVHVCEYNNANDIIVLIARGKMKPQRDGNTSLMDIAASRFKKQQNSNPSKRLEFNLE